MLTAPLTFDEDRRIRLLKAIEILDSPPEDAFDQVTKLAAELLNVPMVAVSLIDRDRQWFKSSVGINVAETPRDVSFCAHAIHHQQMFVVADAAADQRFADNPMVCGPAQVRFYAGVPLRSSEGIALGTLCVIDNKPRFLSERDLDVLRVLADIIRRELLHRETTMLAHQVAEDQLSSVTESETLFRATFERANVGIATVSLEGRWIRFNSKLMSIIGYRASELARMSFQQITHPDDLNLDLAHVNELLSGRADRYTIEKRYLHRDGSIVWVNLSVTLVRNGTEPSYFISVLEDITARKHAEDSLNELRHQLEDRVAQRTRELQLTNDMLTMAMQQRLEADTALRASEAELRAVIENAHDAYVCIDESSVIVDWNRQAEVTFGWTREQAIGRRVDELILAPGEREAHRQRMRTLRETGHSPVLGKRIELSALTSQGREIPCEVSVNLLPSTRGKLYCAFIRDISASKALQRSLEEQALNDPLTGLPNRRALLQRLSEVITRAHRTDRAFVLLFVDLDDFKLVNDTYGHEAGDTVLKQLAQRLKSDLRHQDIVARLAGDEFVVVADHLENAASDATALAEKIAAMAEIPFELGHTTVRVGASVGVSVCQASIDRTAAQLLADADKAMYQSKQVRKQRLGKTSV